MEYVTTVAPNDPAFVAEMADAAVPLSSAGRPRLVLTVHRETLTRYYQRAALRR